MFGLGRYDEANIKHVNKALLSNWIPEQPIGNLCVQGGTYYHRNHVVDYGIARCIGKVGIVVIHNNNYLERDLYNIKKIFPSIFSTGYELPMCLINANNLKYEPFYGLEPRNVVEILYPDSGNRGGSAGERQCAMALNCYLQIIIESNQKLSLDNLLYICNMDLASLKNNILAKLPMEKANYYLAMLMMNNVYTQVQADVNFYANQLDGRIWSRNGGQTDISIVEAVRNKALIAINNAGFSTTVQDYISMELKYILEQRRPFLLVIDSVNIDQSQLKNVVINANNQKRLILSSTTISELFTTRENANNALSNMQQIIIFNAVNAEEATKYASIIGEYFAVMESQSESYNNSSGFMGANKSMGSNTISTSQQKKYRIDPETLTNLGESGAVLIDQTDGFIEKTNYLEFK